MKAQRNYGWYPDIPVKSQGFGVRSREVL